MHERPKVALLIESSRAYGRGLLRGIAAYLRNHRPWSVYVEPHGLDEPPPRWLSKWQGDGILARVNDRRISQTIETLGLPAIDLRGAMADSKIPLLGLNNDTVVQLAFEHLQEHGFRHFAFCGVAPGEFRMLEMRAERFQRLVEASGCSFSSFPRDTDARPAKTWDQQQQQMSRWVLELPKPVGILACHDDRGHELLNACREVQVAVPDDVAVIGVDNDEVLCELSDPPLSSVNSNTEQIGYRAATLLDQMMAGEITLAGDTLMEPSGVVARRSTDTLAIDDREIASAMRFIREHACDGINVEDLLRRIPLSRSTLDRRFAAIFRRSPSDEIMRLRLERVAQLLVETEYPLTKIAALAGFEHSEHMGTLFRRKQGQTPGEYRKARKAAQPGG